MSYYANKDSEATAFKSLLRLYCNITWDHSDILSFAEQVSPGHVADLDGPVVTLKFSDKSVIVLRWTVPRGYVVDQTA